MSQTPDGKPAADPQDRASVAVDAIEVDARGLRCPLPVIRLAEAAREAPSGTRIVVLATDPAARHDIPAWCRMRGHKFVEAISVGETTEAGERATADLGEVSEIPDSSGTEVVTSPEGVHPAYLRCVVKIRRDES